jgi:hypothetical protein
MSAAPEYDVPAPGDPLALERDFDEIGHLITRMGEDVPAHLDVFDTAEAACALLFDLRETRKRLADLEAYVEAQAAGRMLGKVLRFEGFVAERKGGQDRRNWRHDEIAWAVCHPLIVDANGEVDDSAAELVGMVRDRLINCAQISGWRINQLRPLGIEPADYCETTTGRRTVHVRPDTDDEPQDAA